MASSQILYRTINLTTTAQVKFLVHVKSSRSSVFSLGMDVLKGDFEKWNVSIYENVTLKKHLVNFRNFLEFLFHCLTSLMVKKKIPNINSEPPLVQLSLIATHPTIIGYKGEEIGVVVGTSSCHTEFLKFSAEPCDVKRGSK